MADDRDLQHPDITAALRTGYPRRTFPPMPSKWEAYKSFIRENEQDFLAYCLDIDDLVDDYVFDRHDNFQTWQYENYLEVAY